MKDVTKEPNNSNSVERSSTDSKLTPHIGILENKNLHLNPKFTDYLTDCVHTLRRILTRKEKSFILRAYKKNVLSGVPFSYLDFEPEVSNDAFRQYITNLRPTIDVVINSKPKYYKLKGLYLDEKLTERHTDLAENQILFQSLDVILSMVKHERIMMHDIRLEAKVDDLYENLMIRGGLEPNTQNKMITLSVTGNSQFDTKVNVTKQHSLIVMIGCTHNPIMYSTAGIITLAAHCGEVIRYLKALAKTEFIYEPVNNWKFKYFHLNKDSIEYDFPNSNYTLNVIMGHTQIYKHKLPNGRFVIRAEEKLSNPETTMTTEIFTPRFQRADELLDAVQL